jgi:lipopolysaccharide assembly outer membrane protein LptD (OstA)
MPPSAQETGETEARQAEIREAGEAGEAELLQMEAEAPGPEAPGLNDAKIIELDIRSSTLGELAAWCRTLGLSEGGGKEELAGRLRAHYQLETAVPAEGESPASAGRYIIIESARSTEYFTLDLVDEEYARLRGDVKISLKDKEASHTISAQEILYNRTRNQVTARGKVSYVKEEGDAIETFRGDSITVNLDSWATVLTGGISERALAGEETAYRFAGTVISRSEEEVTILKNAKITNARSPEAYWSLNATKLWLLPGSDFALRNAVLKVGEIPVLYLPFFYYPADEMIFHPVLGYRSREGNFLQTTTYLLGRPKAEDLKESSLTKILGSGAEMEKERQGLFLRSTGKKVVNPDETSLKLLFDLYANLGGYFGIEAKTPGKGILKNFEFSGGLGRTRDVMPATLGGLSSFTPFPGLDGESEWNSSQLFSWNIPLRYRLATSGSLSGKVGEFSWELPYYSDPFVNRDFLNRAEAMDWFHIIQEGAALDEELTSDSSLSSYEWRLNGRISISPPRVGARGGWGGGGWWGGGAGVGCGGAWGGGGRRRIPGILSLPPWSRVLS